MGTLNIHKEETHINAEVKTKQLGVLCIASPLLDEIDNYNSKVVGDFQLSASFSYTFENLICLA